MKSFNSIVAWGDAHHPRWLDALRLLLGVFLFAKGLSFIQDKELVAGILKANNFDFIPVLVMHYVIIFQMAHSVLIAIGLITARCTCCGRARSFPSMAPISGWRY
jgi:putative oxidoreductase